VAASFVQPGRDQVPGTPGQRDGADLVALAVQADLAGAGGDREVLGVQTGAFLDARAGVQQHRDDRGVAGAAAPGRAGRLLPRCLASGLAVRIEVFQHGAVGADQPLRHRPLAQPDLFQLRPGLLEDGRHPLAQHLGQVVAGPHPRGVHQARHQRQPLGLLIPRQRVDVLGRRLPGEISDFARRNPSSHCAVSPSSSTWPRYSA